jgi:hypothetical protein
MKFTTIKRLGLPSGLIAAVLAVSSCAEIAMVPAGVVAVPLVAVFFAGFVGVATLSQVMEGFDAQEREREAKPRKDGPFIEYWVNGKKSAVGTYKNKKLDGVYTEYFKSGKKKSELTYVGGERNDRILRGSKAVRSPSKGRLKQVRSMEPLSAITKTEK